VARNDDRRRVRCGRLLAVVELHTHPGIVALAQHFGVAPNGIAITVPCGRYPCLVSLALSSGTVVGLKLHVQTRPLPPISFRQETPSDISQKGTGINVEVQTGDPEFDRRVYVESDAPAHVLRAALSTREARQAAAQLTAYCRSFHFNEHGILLSLPGDPDIAVVRRTVELLAWIVAPLPAFTVDDRSDRSRNWVFSAVLGFPIPFALLMVDTFLWIHFELVGVALPNLLGAFFGLLLALPVAVWAYFYYRRRHDSLSRIIPSVIGVMIAGPLAGIALLLTINCAADFSRPVTHEARVVKCDNVEDADNGNVTLAWKDDSTRLGVDDCDKFPKGAKAYVMVKGGLLGFAWVPKFGLR